MPAPFNDYCNMNHIAKQVGGPKIYSSILVAGGMALGVAAFEGLPKLAAWATPKVEGTISAIKSFVSGTKSAKESNVVLADNAISHSEDDAGPEGFVAAN